MSEKALGMGLDALIKQPKSKKKDSSKKQSKKEKKDKENNLHPFSLSSDKLKEIKQEVEKNPRISLWSVKSAACLKYLKKTTPEFSISSEASLILDEAIQKKYPEIWELFEDL